jgi:hypothetical protein
MNQQLPLKPAPAAARPPLLRAAERLTERLSGRLLTSVALGASFVSRVMTDAFDGSDAAGAWTWRQAYDACEAASLIALRRGAAGETRDDPAALFRLAEEIAARLPLQSKRSETQNRLGQFSTPLPTAVILACAARLRRDEMVLEPSCGVGALATAALVARARVHPNEIDPDRRLLASAVLNREVTRHDAEFVDDLLPGMLRPTAVLMNPPFSSSAARTGDPTIAGRHLVSALKRLAPGGRLAAIMPEGFAPNGASRVQWREACAMAALRAHVALPVSAFARAGARVATAIVVFDKAEIAGTALRAEAATLAEALEMAQAIGERPAVVEDAGDRTPSKVKARATRPAAPPKATPTLTTRREPGAPLTYAPRTDAEAAEADGLYAAYRVARIAIDGAQAHPTPLVESAAMAAIAPPAPTARPLVPPSLVRRGVLSDAQLETLVYAGQAFAGDLPGAVRIDEEWRATTPCEEDDAEAVRLRRGFFLGDGTGCGKGRQVAGVILDQWLQGRRRALWLSKSDKLIEDARRDWTALGGDAGDVKPLAKVKPGEAIPYAQGILFATYATLRVGPRQRKDGRLEQIVRWLDGDEGSAEGAGAEFEGVIAFDEAHAMGGAGGGKSDRGAKKGSQQGVAGLRLQLALPRARVLYVSATGATTVENLAYASRLGLWGDGGGFPFPTREAFVKAMIEGGVAAMEIVARDLKALGLYVARALSFAGVEYEILEHPLSRDQIAVYDAYADAFQVIHANLDRALRATNIVGEDDACNDSGVKAAVHSRFESLKQRFFNHLLTGMKTPAMLDAIAARLAEGCSVVVQLVSTGEALMNRRIDRLSEAERADLVIDATPREYVCEYLREGFPTELRRVCEDENGNPYTEIVRDETRMAVESREACALRDEMIETLCLLTPVQTALDQIVWRFGPDAVAEATGRSRRILRVTGPGAERYKVENRAASANSAETKAFMDGAKRILVFSEAGGTGRSYHADRDAPNHERRVHYLLEAGWKADTAVQGLGRTHRSNQASAPIFVPVTTDVSGERRFISTISRRLDSLGALTRGAAKTGGQGLFRPEDNLESRYARSALVAFYAALVSGAARSITLERFTEKTGLELVTEDGTLVEDLPPITRFLNRILALRIAEQNAIFEEFGEIVAGRVEAAIAAGTYEAGIEALTADSVVVVDRRVVRTCPETGAETIAWRLAVRSAIEKPSVDEALARYPDATMVRNRRSGHVAFRTPYAAFYDEDGAVEPQVRLIRPRGREVMRISDAVFGNWTEIDRQEFAPLWDAAVAELPPFETREIAMISGLILPIWRHLPHDLPRIRRVSTDCGVQLIGRLVLPDALEAVARALAPLKADSPIAVARAVMVEGRAVPLVHGVTLRRRRIGERWRCELENVPSGWVRELKAAGCFVEIIQYRARVFVPMTEDPDERQIGVLTKVLTLLPPSAATVE